MQLKVLHFCVRREPILGHQITPCTFKYSRCKWKLGLERGKGIEQGRESCRAKGFVKGRASRRGKRVHRKQSVMSGRMKKAKH